MITYTETGQLKPLQNTVCSHESAEVHHTHRDLEIKTSISNWIGGLHHVCKGVLVATITECN